MIKSLVLVLITLLFNACSSNIPYTYSSNTNELQFQISDKNYLTKKLQNPKYIVTLDNCTNESYLLKEDRYFIEYISLSTNCTWNGLASGYFEREFKSELKIDSMVRVEEIDIENYSFSTFIINDKYILNMINSYTVFSNTFIIDFEGLLYSELIKQLQPTYKTYDSSLPRFKADYKYSLVDFNFLHNYFHGEKYFYY